MKEKLKYVAVPLLVVGLGVLVWSMWPQSNNQNFPEGTEWLCTNKEPHTFRMTISELAAHTQQNYGSPPKCPTCGQDAYRAEKCPHCGKVVPQVRGQQFCPSCKKPLIPTPPPG